MAWPRAARSRAAAGSGAPSATISCSSTRSRPVTSSVTGCSTCRRVFISRNQNSPSAAEQELDGAGPDVADGAGGGDGGVGHPARAAPRRRPATAPPRRSSGDGAGSSTPARAATTVCRGRRRTPASRRAGRARRSARQNTVPSPNAAAASRSAPATGLVELVGRRARCACPARRRRPTPSRACGKPTAAMSSAPSTLESGSTGTPAARISALASIFEPIASIAAGGGPIHVEPGVDHRAGERRPISARKP